MNLFVGMVMSCSIGLFKLHRNGEVVIPGVFHQEAFDLVEFTFFEGDPLGDVLTGAVLVRRDEVVPPLGGP